MRPCSLWKRFSLIRLDLDLAEPRAGPPDGRAQLANRAEPYRVELRLDPSDELVDALTGLSADRV
jgi:hypothetical protein